MAGPEKEVFLSGDCLCGAEFLLGRLGGLLSGSAGGRYEGGFLLGRLGAALSVSEESLCLKFRSGRLGAEF